MTYLGARQFSVNRDEVVVVIGFSAILRSTRMPQRKLRMRQKAFHLEKKAKMHGFDLYPLQLPFVDLCCFDDMAADNAVAALVIDDTSKRE